MFNKQDGLLLFVALSSIAIGVGFPAIGMPFAGLPKYCMMALLFLSFQSIRLRNVWQTVHSQIGRIVIVLFCKLVLLPVAAYFLFTFIAPQFALAALLLSGISTGVVAPFFADRLTVDTTFVLVIVVLSSVFVPFTLPVLVRFLIGESLPISLADMIKLLCMVIFLPLASVQFFRHVCPNFIEGLHRIRYPLSLVLFAMTNLGVFSGYAAFFKEHPVVIVKSLWVSIGLAVFYLISGLFTMWRRPIENIICTIIVFGIMNNILVIVFSSEFFGALESAVAAIYTIPFYGLIIPLRFLHSWKEKRNMRRMPSGDG